MIIKKIRIQERGRVHAESLTTGMRLITHGIKYNNKNKSIVIHSSYNYIDTLHT